MGVKTIPSKEVLEKLESCMQKSKIGPISYARYKNKLKMN